MKRHLSLLLFAILLGACGYPAGATNTPVPPTETATAVPTATPTPAPVEVAPGEFIPASQIDGFEARDESGKLIYVEGINGEWIKASYEITVPPATAEDWAAVNGRLGTDFVINADGNVTGVEGLNVNKETGAVTFDFDGGGVENYHIQNIKVQEVDGVNRLLVAGYMWNGETKSWEVFNPGFPMESPEAQLGWFVQADVANGNWLRWHQRATEDIDMKALFAEALIPDSFELREFNIQRDFNDDGQIDISHANNLWWKSGPIDWEYTRKYSLKKTQYPWRGGLSYAFLVDGRSAIVSFDILNGDESKTTLPAIMAETVWTEHRENANFTRIALAADHEWDESMAKDTLWTNTPEGWVFWLITKFYPDSTITFIDNQQFMDIMQEPEAAARREEAIGVDKFDPSSSLDIWGTEATYN